MAFNRDNLIKVSGGQGGTPTMFNYRHPADSLATQKGANYFATAADILRVHDLIYLVDEDTPAYDLVAVQTSDFATGALTVATILPSA